MNESNRTLGIGTKQCSRT